MTSYTTVNGQAPLISATTTNGDGHMTKIEAMQKLVYRYFEELARYPAMAKDIPLSLYLARNWRQVIRNAKEREKIDWTTERFKSWWQSNNNT